MRIIVLNLHKYRYIFGVIKITAIALVLLILSGIITRAHISSDRYLATLADENERNLVILDAGHGGEDPGAIGVSGVYEKDLNLEIVKEIGTVLKEKGFAVLYTRTEDKLLYAESENVKGLRKISDLKNRCKIAAEYPKSIFISVHMNSYGDSKYSGMQVYYSTKTDESKVLASSIQSNVKNSVQQTNNRTVKTGNDIYVLENISNTAVLIECGFITNQEECKKLSEKEYQKQLSLAIVCGIIEYKEKISQ